MTERKTITRSDLAESVFRKVGLSRTESASLVDMILDEIRSTIQTDGNVMLSGFGTFQAREKSERIGRNPKTGEEATISRRRVVTFKPSNILKQRVLQAHQSRRNKSKPEGWNEQLDR